MSRAMKRVAIFFLVILLTLCGSSAMAGIAFPGLISFTERTTGEIVPIHNYGDEHFSYMADTDGNLLVEDASGYLRYVTEDGGVFAPGGYRTQSAQSAGGANVNVNVPIDRFQSKLQALMNELAKDRPSAYALPPERIPRNYNFIGDRAEGLAQVCTEAEDIYLDDPSNYPPMLSTCPLLVLKLQFKDVKCVFDDLAWHNRIFENGITQYYRTVSNGKFTYVPVEETWDTPNDGVVTVTLPFNCPRYSRADGTNQLVQNDPLSGLYYDDENKKYAIYNMGSLFAYAMLAADDYVNFDDFDRNNDGFISPTELAVLVVYSGYEVSYGGAPDAQGKPGVWAHSWKYNNMLSDVPTTDYHYITMLVDSKRVSKYTVVGELANYVSEYNCDSKIGTPRQAQYGTATHELGHDMGLADLYPTDPDSNATQEVLALSLMASGSWCAAPGGEVGSSPTHLDPLSKLYLGFYDAVYTDSSGRFTLYATEPSDMYNILRVNTDDPNIYYLIENRQYVGYDRGLCMYFGFREGGVVIWRADREVLTSCWRPNTINNVDGHYGLMPVFVNGVDDPFWSAASQPSSIILQRSPLIKLSMHSLPDGSMTFSVDRETRTVPLTGDRFQPALWIALGLAALLGIVAFCVVKRKKRVHAKK